MEYKKISFQRHGDSRGELVVLEIEKQIPFQPKRFYYVFDVASGQKRGSHAHKTVKQIFITLKGSVEVLLDDGTCKKKIVLNSPYEGLLIPEKIWSDLLNFSKDAIFLVIASDFYCESEYIRDYNNFLNIVKLPGGK